MCGRSSRKPLISMFTLIPNLVFRNNPKLHINKHSLLWKDWVNKGIITLADIYDRGNIKSFERLAGEYNLPRNNFWKYLQTRHLLITVIGRGIEPQQTNLLSQTTKIMGVGGTRLLYSMQ